VRICVYGLWHLGCVTAACLAETHSAVIGLDSDVRTVDALKRGEPPVAEPGLADLIQSGLERGSLTFTSDARAALVDADVLWVTFDTPVDDQDNADVAWVREQLDDIRPWLAPGTLVLVSSQVPVGFSRALERDWQAMDASLRFASSPENLRLGQALGAFRQPERIVVGLGRLTDPSKIREVFGTLAERIIWMSLESAEMTKHALNAFLATSVVYANELARICERVGADAAEVERGLRTEPRVGPRAYVSAGGPIAGGTLARDVQFLTTLASEHGLASPLFSGVQESNRVHLRWIRDRITELVADVQDPRVAILGLTYKAGTDTLRRSAAVELAVWLTQRGVDVRAYDPAVHALPDELGGIHLSRTVEDAIEGTDVAVLATPWPEFKDLGADRLVSGMRRPQFIDQVGSLPHLATDQRVRYVRVGRSVAASLR
jgi:UDPglucose 6-dehydrogenase